MTTAATSQQTRLVTPARRRACTCRSLWLSFPVIHDNSGDNRSHGQQEEGSCPAVVDVYQGWCGPCKPVVSLFQKMRIEVGLDLLHFALAEADHLDVLEKYRGKCEPTFLFYAIKDEALSDEDECVSHGKNNGEDEDMVSSERTCTLAIIKPDAVAHGKTDEIIMKIQEAGFEILTNEERTMTEAEMRLFYQHRAGEETFEKLVHHMCSGPSHLLILTRTEGFEDVVTTWRTVIGPCDPNVARREQPESLRAQYGTEMPFNAIHGSRDREDADRELALLFPSLKFSDKNTEALQGKSSRQIWSLFNHRYKAFMTVLQCVGD
ncbi:thioredoxin domain-containing protein 6 isoform X9 [Saimiri boliviensis]|uniref:thioredoxin domain-containing protein 6 isoform X9 n=1 Tax=Saimiri boliviensis TaxID=27679 RepID=UPI003D783993